MMRGAADFQTNLLAARNGNFTYLVAPEILHWEDPATEWFAIADRIQIKIQIMDPVNGQTLEAGLLEGKSIVTTFEDYPEDLLSQPIFTF